MGVPERVASTNGKVTRISGHVVIVFDSISIGWSAVSVVDGVAEEPLYGFSLRIVCYLFRTEPFDDTLPAGVCIRLIDSSQEGVYVVT